MHFLSMNLLIKQFVALITIVILFSHSSVTFSAERVDAARSTAETENAPVGAAEQRLSYGRLATFGLPALVAGINYYRVLAALGDLRSEKVENDIFKRVTDLNTKLLDLEMKQHAEVLYRGSGIFPTNLDVGALKAGDKLDLNLSPLSDRQVLLLETEQIRNFQAQLDYLKKINFMPPKLTAELDAQLINKAAILESAHTSDVAMEALRKSNIFYQTTVRLDMGPDVAVSRTDLKYILEAYGKTGRSIKTARVLRARDVQKFEAMSRPLLTTDPLRTPRAAALRSLRSGLLGFLLFGGLATEEYFFGYIARTLGLEDEAQEKDKWRLREALPPSQR